MKGLLSIIAYGFDGLTIFYLILFSQREAEWIKTSIFRQFAVQPPLGVLLAGFFIAVAFGAHVFLHILPPPFISDTAANIKTNPTTYSKLATSDDLKKELEGEGGEKVNVAEAYFKAAFHDLEKNRFDDAIKNCQKSIDTLPSITAYLNLAGLLTYTRQYARTEEAFAKGIELAQKRGNVKKESILLSNRSAYYFERGQTDKALLDINKAIELDPNNSDAHFNLAACYCDTFLYDEAEKELDKAQELSGDERDMAGRDTRDYDLRGIIRTGQGRYDEAILEFNKAIQANPKFFPAYNNRGIAYFKKGHLDLAMSDFSKAIQLNPKFGMAYSNRGTAYSAKGMLDQGISDLDMAIHLDPRNPKLYLMRGRMCAEKKLYDRAILDFNKVIEIDPKDEKAYLFRGMAYELRGQHDKALSDFRKATELNANYAEAHFFVAKALTKKGLTADALLHYDKAIELNPQYADALINRSMLYIGKQELERALVDLNKAIEINPKSAEAYNNRGMIYLLQGRVDDALSDLNKAIHLKPDHVDALLNRANMFKHMGLTQKAAQDYKKACSLGIQAACKEYENIAGKTTRRPEHREPNSK